MINRLIPKNSFTHTSAISPNFEKPDHGFRPIRLDRFTSNSFLNCSAYMGESPDWKEISSFLDLKSVSQVLQKKVLPQRQAVNYREVLQGARVIMFGDRHDEGTYEEKELIAHLKEFKDLGVTHLGLEMIPSDFQSDLDDYFKRGGDIPLRVVAHIRERNQSLQVRNGYLSLIKAARSQGINLVGIEHPDVSHGLGKDSGAALEIRNPHWALKISQIIQADPRHKMVVFGGVAHFGYPGNCQSVNLLLKDYGVAVTDVKVVHFRNSSVDYSAKKAGLDQERFMIKIQKPMSNPGADYIIHLPGTGKSLELD